MALANVMLPSWQLFANGFRFRLFLGVRIMFYSCDIHLSRPCCNVYKDKCEGLAGRLELKLSQAFNSDVRQQ